MNDKKGFGITYEHLFFAPIVLGAIALWATCGIGAYHHISNMIDYMQKSVLEMKVEKQALIQKSSKYFIGQDDAYMQYFNKSIAR
ncbi:hypothetical protein COV93_03660 [Candidatus Woesearchaeota archaeon CG11_big_fil_rev_8_21_14_0_20_43_8]|nr:MAG: hypothetical protein COV93_03660 [Candidatus Woesearchaeota archaeon CG11_big_fil_rev_8_21_14_0_20_43_8]PIO08954.1 MAG: hypothetical protein COT47_00445 [Candidatus Woesearchaeota archaeon CG08_land_8_20_14_0_20_43_7]